MPAGILPPGPSCMTNRVIVPSSSCAEKHTTIETGRRTPGAPVALDYGSYGEPLGEQTNSLLMPWDKHAAAAAIML